MTSAELQDRLQRANDAFKAAHITAANAIEDLARAKTNLTANENACILAGLEGKNETERKAHLSKLTTNDQVHLENAETALRDAQLALTLARLDDQLARNLLQLHTHQTGGDDQAN